MNQILAKPYKISDKDFALLRDWQSKYERAYSAYQPTIESMIDNEQAYMGTRKIKKPDGTDADNGQSAVPCVRKVVYELIESQVDSNIPMPKVTPMRAADNDRALSVEEMLKNQIDRLPFEVINDEQERICPVDGASFFLVEWDALQDDLSVKALHPRNVIPQPGVSSIEDSDYIFVLTEHTRDSILRQFGVDIGDEPSTAEEVTMGEEQTHTVTDVYTMKTVYYRNKDGDISLMSWVDSVLVEKIDDYQKRKKDICSGCGVDWDYALQRCSICGSEEYEMSNRDTENIVFDMTVGEGQNAKIIPAGSEIPYYTPNVFPIAMRKNISQYGQFCGGSDAQAVKDNQNDINIYMNKLRKKTLKGGSIVIKHPEMKMDTSDEELKIANATADQSAALKIVNVQADVQYDLAIINSQYEFMRQTLGITDSFQGRPDPTAPSGTAKQLQVAQSAGRLESKRRMKDAAYADLYELMFKFALAYSDDKRQYRTLDVNGDVTFKEFDKFDFVEQIGDEWVWNDKFLFSVDDSSALSRNRELMWQEVRLNYQNGCYGPPGDLMSVTSFWQYMKLARYPNAKQMHEHFSKLLQAQQIQQEQMAQQQMMLQQQQAQQTQPQAQPAQIPAASGDELDALLNELGV